MSNACGIVTMGNHIAAFLPILDQIRPISVTSVITPETKKIKLFPNAPV